MPRVVITGAYSYTGAAVAWELLSRGCTVHTLTNRRPPEGETSISSAPLRFDMDHLVRELAGADAFVNTYWVRLPHSGESFETAVCNSRTLLAAAAGAGVKRIVQVSVSNAAAGANLGYYAGKAQVEALVRESGLPYAIVRPTLILGPADVLTNNIAWFLRRFPVFPLPGGGGYRLQPVTLRDTARIVSDALFQADNTEIDAAGPDILTFREYVRLVAQACHVRPWIFGAPDSWALGALKLTGLIMRDIILTREELLGLKQELLMSHSPPLGQEPAGAWLRDNGEVLGRAYANDLRRHFGAGRGDPILSRI